MDFSVKGNRIEFLQNGQQIDLGKTKEGQSLGVKGCESSECSALWKWFSKDVMGWTVEVRVGNTNLLIDRKSAIRLIQRSNLLSGFQENQNELITNNMIKSMLEGRSQGTLWPVSKPTPGKPADAAVSAGPIVAMKLAEWQAQLQSQLKDLKTPITEDFLTSHGFHVNKDGLIAIDKAKLSEFMAKFVPVHNQVEQELHDAASEAAHPVSTAAARAADSAKLAAARAALPPEPTEKNATLRTAIEALGDHAIMPRGDAYLVAIANGTIKGGDEESVPLYAFCFEPAKEGEDPSWHLYVAHPKTTDNTIWEVRIHNGKFQYKPANNKWTTKTSFNTLEDLVKAAGVQKPHHHHLSSGAYFPNQLYKL